MSLSAFEDMIRAAAHTRLSGPGWRRTSLAMPFRSLGPAGGSDVETQGAE